MGAPLLQPTFSGGELSPSLYARVDIERYGNSVKTAKNFLVRPTGGLVNRPGLQFIGEVKDSAKRVRLIPFEFSVEVAYVIELGDLYARFYANGAPVLNVSTPVEVVTPWTEAELPDVKFTQTADVMILTHPNHAPRKLSRTSATAFVLEEFVVKEGPFRDVNADEALKVAVSARAGNVTVTANTNIFTADMVGLLLYVEAKSLGQVKPWTQGDRSVTVGTLRRSDGKTYRATTVAAAPGGGGWVECGSFRPVHQQGREWDGPQDTRTDGTRSWIVGVEWEYQDSGYGIVRLTGFTNATTMTGTVVRELPDGVVGGLGAPARSWTFSGNGTTTVFSTTGAVSTSRGDYTVTIDGVPVQPDPNYIAPGGIGGGDGGRGGIGPGGFFFIP
jgi:hypothetical protein